MTLLVSHRDSIYLAMRLMWVLVGVVKMQKCHSFNFKIVSQVVNFPRYFSSFYLVFNVSNRKKYKNKKILFSGSIIVYQGF